MTKPEAVRGTAIQLKGCPYVYGGTGKVCTPAYREARMNQYSKYADKIRKNCPRLSGSATSCKNCKWCDPETGEGKLCYDCAQFALACMKAAGIPLVSGANSQWLKTRFSEKGEINGLPRDKVALVFRKDGSKMKHVAVYMGDGTVIHAKGHDYGVVQERLDEVSKPFTHYGITSGLYDNVFPTVRRGNSGEYVVTLQKMLTDEGYGYIVGDIDGKFGAKTEAAVKAFQTNNGLTADGICGAKTWAALQKENPIVPDEPDEPEEDEPDEDEPDEEPDDDMIEVEREQLLEWREQMAEIIDELDRMLR
jgi:cell wall-associated NlpC family hydrolase